MTYSIVVAMSLVPLPSNVPHFSANMSKYCDMMAENWNSGTDIGDDQ
jgi:hypothetical protein